MINSKWPRLLVTGDDVTTEQANEILVRTDSWHLMCNDRVFAAAVAGLVGIQLTNGLTDWRSAEAFCRAVGALDLGYVGNDRIVSSWLGGPHGWCDWDGRIGCSTYNIGKWPSDEAVTEEWREIAAAFPYLKLRAQLVEDEGEGAVCAGWNIEGGSVTVVEELGEQIRPVCDLSDADYLACLGSVSRERGVTLDRLRQAVEQVRRGREA